jgi:hypothetical protein
MNIKSTPKPKKIYALSLSLFHLVYDEYNENSANSIYANPDIFKYLIII